MESENNNLQHTPITDSPESGISYETKTVIVVITLLFATPVGIILMWLWMKWKLWIKILITILPILFALFITIFVFAILGVVFLNPKVQNSMQKSITAETSQTINQPEDPTVTWKTCETKTYSLQYPQEWIGTCTDTGAEFKHKDTTYNGIPAPITGYDIHFMFGTRFPLTTKQGEVSRETVTWLQNKAVLRVIKWELNDLVVDGMYNEKAIEMVMTASSDKIREQNKELFLQVANTLKIK